jgi:hypothetical protein
MNSSNNHDKMIRNHKKDHKIKGNILLEQRSSSSASSFSVAVAKTGRPLKEKINLDPATYFLHYDCTCMNCFHKEPKRFCVIQKSDVRNQKYPYMEITSKNFM